MAGVLAIYADIDPNLTPALRRCAQRLLVMCLCTEAVGSYVWGNDIAGTVSLSVSKFEFVLDNQITSCITSQAVLAVYLAYVGWRSRRGRGWYYASLRFELDLCGRASLSQISMVINTQDLNERIVTSTSCHEASAPTSGAEVVPDSMQGKGAPGHCLSRARQCLLRLQQRLMLNCRVFVIPCVAVKGKGGGDAEFALARPTFDLRFLQPLHFIVDAHPKIYCGFLFFCLAVPSMSFSILLQPQIRGIPTLFFNTALVICILGFLSSKKYNLDKIAVKQVVLSFRFPIFVVLLSQWIALDARRAFLVLNEGPESMYYMTPWDVAAVTMLCLLFCLCLLFDCSPHLPAAIQILTTVRACKIALHQIESLMSRAGWMVGCFRTMGFLRNASSVCRKRRRLLLESRRVSSVRCHSRDFDLQQPFFANDASAVFPHPCARQEQLRQRVGDAFVVPAFRVQSACPSHTRHRFCPPIVPRANLTMRQAMDSPTKSSQSRRMQLARHAGCDTFPNFTGFVKKWIKKASP
jgi:hypothetical protein